MWPISIAINPYVVLVTFVCLCAAIIYRYIMAAINESPSSKLYDFLENVGASQKNRESTRQTATMIETLLNSYIFKDYLTIYLCGGMSEGSIIPFSVHDTDFVLCLNDTPVVFDINDKKPGLYYLAENTDQPGYVKLKLLKDGKAATKSEIVDHPGYVKLKLFKDGKAATTSEIDDRAHNYFKTVDDKNMYLTHALVSSFAELISETQVAGPAIATFDEFNEHKFDCVVAIKSENIPPFACEWITNLVTSGWLSEDQVDTMKQMGCMFVGVGFPDDKDSDLEWRVSFILQERFLMSCLNDVQLKVYILLKIFKKYVIDVEIKEESISSYHCKSCLLHVITNTPEDIIFSKENLIGCLERCLRYMRDRLQSGNCTNVFVDKQNLFARERFQTLRNPLIKLLDEMVMKDPSSVFEHITRIINEHRNISTHYQFEIKGFLIGVSVAARDLLLHQIRPVSYKGLEAILSNIEKSTDDNVKVASAYVTPWIEIRMGMWLAANSSSIERDETLDNDLITKAFEHIQKGLCCDVLNVPLAKATILLQFKKYQECLKMLQESEKCISQDTVVACYCEWYSRLFRKLGTPMSVQIHYEDHVAYIWGDKDINTIRKTMFAGCFCFLPSEEALVPKPLQNEMKLCKNENKGTQDHYSRSCVMVEARVYLFTLFYLVGDATADRQLQNDAIEKLTKALQYNDHLRHQDGHLRHNEVGYNILGWIMIQEEKYSEAVSSFSESLKFRPYNNNAAKYHIQDLFGRLDEDEQKRLMKHVLPD